MICNCRQNSSHVLNPDPALWYPPNPGKLITLHKTGGTGQRSSQIREQIPVSVGSTGKVIFQYNVPVPGIPPGGKHCSDVRMHFLWDGQEVAVSDWLGYPERSPALPLKSSLYLLTAQHSGQHILTLQPEGRSGGCNSGNLYAWDGTLLIYS